VSRRHTRQVRDLLVRRFRQGEHGEPAPPDAPSRETAPHEPPRHEPPRHEPPRHEPPRHEPPRHEPPRYEPPRHEPPRYESGHDGGEAEPGERRLT
jgi:hypothetical protein